MEKSNGELISKAQDSTGKIINLQNNLVLDLQGLSDEEINELRQQHASGTLEIHKKASELKVDVGALDAVLSSFNDQTSKANQSGVSATITHTQTTALGRTEVVIGNTEKAAKGKLSRSATGEDDKTMWIVIIVAIAAVLIAMAL